jgi:hypothetical protein
MRFGILLLAGTAILTACGKKGGGGGNPNPPPVNEATLAVTLDPAVGSVQLPALGPYNLKVTVTSAMPANGVKIEVTAKKDDGTNPAPFFSSTVNATAAVTNFTITGTPLATQCLVQVQVTSLTKPSNIFSGSYRYASK